MSPVTDAEERVIAGLLGGGAQFLDEMRLKPTDFSTPYGEILYGLILQVAASGKPVDHLTVIDAIGTLDEVDRRNVDPVSIWNFSGTSGGSVTFYADMVLAESARRSLALHSAKVAQMVGDGRPVEQILAEAERSLASIGDGNASDISAVGETIDETLESLDEKVTYTETPWDNLNHFIKGWRPGGLYIIAARPSVGKTVAALQSALSLANRGPVAFTSLEMSSSELELRMVSQEARIDMGRITSRKLSNDDWKQVVAQRQRWGTLPLFIDKSAESTVEQVSRHAHTVKRKHGLTAVVVDYLQLMTSNKKTEYETVTDNSRRLKLLAQQLDVPVIVLSQLNRGSEQRTDKTPQMSDLRSSGAIEQDADVVILMHRNLQETPHEADLIVAKNRHGITGTADMDFIGHHSMLRDGVRGWKSA